MKVAPMGEVRNHFGKYLMACNDEPIFVTKNGKITAVIEHIEDSGIEDFLLERDARFRRMLDRTKREKGGMSLKQYRKARDI
ncbi:MAG TPA: type II toxin-antitoxin system Phd/YefM family antitoxin [Spirochaetales bacterium]|nr:type II toxin-antitoxin system Phd/YefM family antitoxin [Spirochaetales bacterium]